MDSPLIAKMEQFTAFSEDDRRLLNELTSERTRRYPAGHDLVTEGVHSPDVHIVMSGLACRYKILEDGTRQIVAFLVPGDPCDAEIFILKEMDHNIGTLAPSLISFIAGERMKEVLLARPGIAMAFWWNTLQDEGVLRERIIDQGRRDAYSRLAFLIYEVFVRLRASGVIEDESFTFPVTQTVLADATGLTPVHVNRTLQRLRKEKLLSTAGKRWTILNASGLRKAANFHGNHLHLDRATDFPQTAAARRVKGLL